MLFIECADELVDHTEDIEKTEILYIAETFDPVHKRTLTITDLGGIKKDSIFSVVSGSLAFPTFSPDGMKILFSLQNDTIPLALYTIDISGNNLAKVSDSHIDYTYNPYSYSQFLSDGITIIYITRANVDEYQIRKLNTKTNVDELVLSGEFYNIKPEITEDNEWIIFWENFNLYKFGINSGEKIQITNNNVFSERFHLNKKTNELVFRSYDENNPWEMNIAKINLDGSDFIKYNFEGQFPVLSNNGDYIIYNALGNDSTSIWIANSDGTNSRVLISHYTWDSYFQFSPDDDLIVFVRVENDYAIYSCDINGQNLKRITPFDYYGFGFPQFRPDIN